MTAAADPETPAVQAALVLPVAALSSLQRDTVNAAVRFLNNAVAESGLQLASVVSQYVVNTFFDGDASQLSSRDPHKKASFAALCERPDLHMGANTLRRLVRVGQQLQFLPQDVAARLSPSHHRALLAVEDTSKKVELAAAAVAENWSVVHLEEVAAGAKVPREGPRIGRPPKAPLVKAVAALRRAVEGLGDEVAVVEGLAGLTAAERQAVAQQLQALVGMVQSAAVAAQTTTQVVESC